MYALQGAIDWKKLDRPLFTDTVLTDLKEEIDRLRAEHQTVKKLLFDGASIHTGATYRWLEDNNIPHLKSWSKKRRLDVNPSDFYSTYSPDFNPAEFFIYLIKENAFKILSNIQYPTRQQVINAITQAYNEVPMRTVKKMVKKGWRKRLKQCIANNGDVGSLAFGTL